MKIYPNKEFISTKSKARKKWHDALVTCPYGQARTEMEVVDHGETYQCCLMVGHVAFDGNKDQMTDGLPLQTSPFIIALRGWNPDGPEDEWDAESEFDPMIGTLEDEEHDDLRSITASACNDDYELSFEQIAMLVYPEAYTSHPVEIEI